jgi:uncharacterized protein (TIGR02270 family)
MVERAAIPLVLAQHAEELAILWNTRRTHVSAGHVALRHLARFDERIAAHQDGCAVAGEYGSQKLKEQLADPGPAQVFAAAVVALDAEDRTAFDHCLAVVEAVPKSFPGLASAVGWITSVRLKGVANDLLNAKSPIRRRLGLAACRFHRADPGQVLDTGLRDPDVGTRAEALRTAGALGRRDVEPQLRAITHDGPEVAFRAAWAGVLLGDRRDRVEALANLALAPQAYRMRAMELALRVMEIPRAHSLLQRVAQNSQDIRYLIRGAGVAGDPHYVPWLIKQMGDVKLTRLAGESLSTLTGLDLAYQDLERKPPENFETGPNDDPDDPNVEMDEDDGLPWPDLAKCTAWWNANKHQFKEGVRYFMGKPPSHEHCIEVLKTGYQRQRIAAAQYLCLLNPGTPLFNTSAPAWRQQRWLAKMT